MIPKWLQGLSDEDLAFLRRFILASGSLKEVAQGYSVTYPTLRLRLDRLIEKIKILESFESQSDFERMLRAYYAEGKLEAETFKTLLAAYQSGEKEKKDGKAV